VGTDLLTVDVSVVDSDGRPVEGLTPADFTIKIDGKVRKVEAAEISKPREDTTASQGRVPSDLNLAQTAAARPRHVLFVVDQLYIPPGSIKPLMISAARFLDRLAPRDEAGFIAFPVGPHVDFTTDRNKVREAMTGMIGMALLDRIGLMAIGIGEARTVNDRERHLLAQAGPTGQPPALDERTPILLTLFERNCPQNGSDRDNETCKQQILAESSEIAQRSRVDAKASVRTLESIVKQMAPIEGSKSMILVSAALATEEQRDVDELIRLAAATRTSFNVLIVDPLEEKKNIGLNPYNPARPQPNTELDDRRIRNEGLEEVAADGRGAVYRISGNGEGVFTRLATELSASYVLGLESLPEDVGKDRRKVEVSVKRPGARIRTAQAYINTAAATTSASRPVDLVLREALSTAERSEVPLRVATFSRWDTASDKVRVNLTASVGAPGASPDDFTVAYVVLDKQNKTVASDTKRPARPDAATANQGAPFGAALVLDPGVYSLRLSVVNGEGRRSTVIRELDASRKTVDDLGTSDLLIGDAPAQGQGLTPVAEAHVSSGTLAAYLELYSDKPEDLDWTFVHVDVVKDEKGEALATEEAHMVNGTRPSWRVATGVVALEGLAPGAYIARARIVRDDKTLRVLTRPFVIESPSK
jgi:VWFA-related protein